MNLVDENNVEVLRKFFHPGYMYVRDLEMLSPDKLIANLDEFASGVGYVKRLYNALVSSAYCHDNSHTFYAYCMNNSAQTLRSMP